MKDILLSQLINANESDLTKTRTYPEHRTYPERTWLRSVLKPEHTFFILPSRKVRSGFSTERSFQNFRFSTTFWF